MVNWITENMDDWIAAEVPKPTGGRGRGKNGNGQSPYGIKKLRELILDLAVRGKLVPQDPSDEPASVLLEKVAREKARLIKEGKIKKQKPLPEIGEDEKSFDLPEGWEWTRLKILSEIKGGKRLPKGHSFSLVVTPYIYIQVTNMKGGTITRNNLKYISQETFSEISRYTISKEDLYITIAGTIGDVGVVPKEFDRMNLTENAAKIVFREVDREWLQKTLSSQMLQRQFMEKTNQLAQPKLALHRVASSCIALPPLAEQHRIVAKVDELMTLCNQLEQQQTDSNATHQALVETLLTTLTHAADQSEFAKAWQRTANHFDTLFTTEQSIDQLKQTILQLAVMGKLVPQDPNDEPASELLKKIANEKARLIKEGKIKKQKPLPDITENEKPFDLPEGWEWASLLHFGAFSGGKTPSKAKNIYWDGDIPWVTPKDMKVPEILDTKDHVTALALKDGLALNYPDVLLFVVRSGILRRSFPVAIAKIPCTVNQDLKVLVPYLKDLCPYIYLMMRGFEEYILKNLTKTGMTVESIMFDQFSKHYFMLPPLAEQQRIVAKVDELMTLCDTLKTRLNDAQTTQVHLADAIVEQVVA